MPTTVGDEIVCVLKQLRQSVLAGELLDNIQRLKNQTNACERNLRVIKAVTSELLRRQLVNEDCRRWPDIAP